MIKIISLITLILFFSIQLHAGDKPAYVIYDRDGDEVDYEDLADAASESDIVFFGELHNNPISHWLQYELTKSMHESAGDNLVLGAEMFESDDQVKIDEYLGGIIKEKSFEDEARLWKNYKTDYKPLMEFANDNGLYFVATNTPRRYAALVADRGFEALDSLSDVGKSFIAPLPIEVDLDLPGYKNMEKMMMAHPMPSKMPMPGDEAKKPPSMAEINKKITRFKQAQALKDATMAHFILENYQDGKKFIHYNGAYHSNNYEGITWFIKRDKPEAEMLTITTIEKDDIESITEEEQKTADFIIVVPSSMTKTN